MNLSLEMPEELAEQFAALSESDKKRFRERVNAFAVAALSANFAEATQYSAEDDLRLTEGIAAADEGRVRLASDAFIDFAHRHGFKNKALR